MSFISTLVVDDIAIERRGLRSLIEHMNLGIHVETAENGVDALEIIRNGFVPDIIVADIRMPLMDGLELSRRVLEERPETKIIIVSAYDQFSYAQSALRIGVMDYILKPIDIISFEKVFRRAYDEVIRQRSERIDRFQSWILQHILMPARRSGEERDLPWQGILLPGAVFCRSGEVSTLISRSGIFPDENLFRFQVDDSDSFLILHDIPAELRSPADAARSFDQLARFIAAESGEPCVILLGDFIEGVQQLSREITGLDVFLERIVNISESGVILIHDPLFSDSPEETVDSSLHSLSTSVLSAMDAADAEDTCETLRRFAFTLRGMPDSHLRRMRRCSANLAELVLACFPYPDKPDFAPSDLYDCKSMNELADGILRCREALMQSRPGADDPEGSIVSQIDQYIETHYAEDISLQSIADRLHYSMGYVSSLYREATGSSIVKTVTRRRIEEAGRLLKHTTLTSAEISQKVGFSSPSYFGQVFRAATGETPNEYREHA